MSATPEKREWKEGEIYLSEEEKELLLHNDALAMDPKTNPKMRRELQVVILKLWHESEKNELAAARRHQFSLTPDELKGPGSQKLRERVFVLQERVESNLRDTNK